MLSCKRNLRFLIIGATISTVGDWLNTLALMSMMVEISNSGVELSALMMLRALPKIVLGPIFAGFIDRFDKKKILIISCIINSVVIIFIPVFDNIICIYIITVILSTIDIFTYPTIRSLIPLLVEKEDLVKVNATYSSVTSVIDISAPLLSGIILSIFTLNTCFFIDSASFIAFLILVLLIRYDGNSQETYENEQESVLINSKNFFKIIRKNNVLFKVIQGSFLGNLSLGIIYVTEILFFERILHVQSNHYGFFVAIVGIGLLLGALMIQKIKGHLYDVFALGVILFGLGITLFSFTTELYLTVLLLIIEGIGEALFTIATVSLIQLNSNKDNCAGLLTINESLSKAAYLISISISGFLIDFINVQYTMLIAGIISLAYGFIYVFNCIHGINATDEATLSKGGR